MFKPFTFLCLFIAILVTGCNNNRKKINYDKQEVSKDSVMNSIPAKKTIVFFGNSLTAGFGLEPSQAFPALVQDIIDSLKLNYKVINAGVSGETSSGGLGRIDWILRQPLDVFVLELGGNDGLRGIPLSVTGKKLQAIIDKVKAKYPEAKIVLAGMQIPPNMGQDYTRIFKRIYPELASKNNIALIPFLLEGVGGNPDLNQQDGIHPNAEGAKIVAQNVWKILKEFCKR
jgi:acyl-CoA thioesterase-1